MNNKNYYSVDRGYINMLSSFRINDLKTLLRAFGRKKTARKSELKNQAIELLMTRTANFDHSAYKAKIYEIYCSLPHGMPSNDIMTRSSLQNQQQQKRKIISFMGLIQNPPQRMNQQPQHPQLSLQNARAHLHKVMYQIYRDDEDGNHISNSTPANNMDNNNIQYITVGSYQPSRTCTIVSHQLPPNQQMSIVVQDTLGLGTTASGNNSYTPSIETVAQIKFKKLPFYEVIDEVIKPTLLTGTDICTIQNVPEGMKEATFKPILSVVHINLVAMNRDISDVKKEFTYQFLIRICELIEPVPNESPDYTPLGLLIRVGMMAYPFQPNSQDTRLETESRKTATPIDCTQYVKLNPIVDNSITINWIPDGKNYVFAMYFVKKLTVDTLIKKLQDKGGRSSEETKNYIIKKLADVDSDLATTSYRFSLMCPLGKTRMKIPAKSIHCDHLQCFDASTFILMNEKKPSWICPTCNKPCLYDDIQIENYFLEVVSSPTLKYYSKEIEIFADGTWKVHEETKETKNTNSTLDKIKPIDYVDLDSDDEKCFEPKIEPSPESSRTQEPENFKSSFIDLTLSDDEEPPTEK